MQEHSQTKSACDKLYEQTSARNKFHEQKSAYKSSKNKINLTKRKISMQQVSLPKLGRNKFHEQKLARNKFHEQKSVPCGENSMYRVHQEKIQNAIGFTNKNQHATSST